MENISSTIYSQCFVNHVYSFMERARLLPPGGKIWVGVSGGMDSIALLYCVWRLQQEKKINEVRAIHINHGTRKENEKEQLLVINFCQRFGIDCRCYRLNLPKGGNFEQRARTWRYRIFSQHLDNNDYLYTGHHIDDSLEWSLLQSLKSSSWKSSLGIPVINGQIARPFMCVSRRQIYRLVKELELPFCHDPSNQDPQFERNFIRHQIVGMWAQRFPNYIKHYVHRSNRLAQKLGLARSSNGEVISLTDRMGGIGIINADFSKNFHGNENIFFESVAKLSDKKRGVLGLQVTKMIEASCRGQKGPLLFSGGVLGLMEHGCCYFINKANVAKYQQLDRELLAVLHAARVAQIPGGYNSIFKEFDEKLRDKQSATFPFLTFSWDQAIKKVLPSARSPHFLFPLSTKYAIDQGIWFNSLTRLLFFWKRDCNINKKLSLLVPWMEG